VTPAAPTGLMREMRRRLRDIRLRHAIREGKGTPREAVVERTHIGPYMDTIVARTKRRMQPAGLDPDYDLAHEHFDVTHFLLQARQMLTEEEIDPLANFLANGAEALASPEINFNMGSYLERYPARADGPERSPYLEWLKRGKAAGEIADPAPRLEKMAQVLGMQPRDLADRLAATRSELQERLLRGTLGEMFARAAEVEPLIGDVWGETTQPMLPPLQSAATVDQVAAIHACQQAAGFARARLVLVLSDPRWGGGRRAEGHITHALTEQLDPEDIVVIYTDGGGTAPRGRFPAGVREIDFASAGEGMARPAARRALVELIRSFRAEAVVTIASRLFYEAMTPYGKAMAASERIFLVMFCNERVAMGNWVGLPLRYFYRYFDLVEGVITDSAYLANWLRDRHQLPDEATERIHVLRAPVDPDIPLARPREADPSRRPQVFWAGRWDRQKRMDIALDVARLMPDVDFRMWGETVLTRAQIGGTPPENVRLEGRYADFSELDLSEADTWLYTSGWDGVPGLLLEVAMTGVPIVGSLVGGTGEVLGDEDSWPVREIDDPEAYAKAIREVLADPGAARRRAEALRDRLLRERTHAPYAKQVAELLIDDDRPGKDDS
jgi:glycosyltransferase involved in cell wall biosynthesis